MDGVGVADRFESIIDTTAGQVHDLGYGIAIACIDRIGSAECLGIFEFVVAQVHSDYAARTS